VVAALRVAAGCWCKQGCVAAIAGVSKNRRSAPLEFKRFANWVRYEKVRLRAVERAFGIGRPDAKFRRSLIALLWQFYRMSLPARIRDRAAYKAAVSAAVEHGEKFVAIMAELRNAEDPAAGELWMAEPLRVPASSVPEYASKHWRGIRTDFDISPNLLAVLRRQADTLPDDRRDGRPPAAGFTALMAVLAEHHAARAGVPPRHASIAHQLMAGVPPADVAAHHGISADVIQQQFAPYIGVNEGAGHRLLIRERTLVFSNWDPEFTTATADVAPGFFGVAAAVTDLLRNIALRGVKLDVPKTDGALAQRLKRMGLKSPKPNRRC
jgi:hypothetical protein